MIIEIDSFHAYKRGTLVSFSCFNFFILCAIRESLFLLHFELVAISGFQIIIFLIFHLSLHLIALPKVFSTSPSFFKFFIFKSSSSMAHLGNLDRDNPIRDFSDVEISDVDYRIELEVGNRKDSELTLVGPNEVGLCWVFLS